MFVPMNLSYLQSKYIINTCATNIYIYIYIYMCVCVCKDQFWFGPILA